MELEFKDIEYLCAVEQQRSISKAAPVYYSAHPQPVFKASAGEVGYGAFPCGRQKNSIDSGG